MESVILYDRTVFPPELRGQRGGNNQVYTHWRPNVFQCPHQRQIGQNMNGAPPIHFWGNTVLYTSLVIVYCCLGLTIWASISVARLSLGTRLRSAALGPLSTHNWQNSVTLIPKQPIPLAGDWCRVDVELVTIAVSLTISEHAQYSHILLKLTINWQKSPFQCSSSRELSLLGEETRKEVCL